MSSEWLSPVFPQELPPSRRLCRHQLAAASFRSRLLEGKGWPEGQERRAHGAAPAPTPLRLRRLLDALGFMRLSYRRVLH